MIRRHFRGQRRAILSSNQSALYGGVELIPSDRYDVCHEQQVLRWVAARAANCGIKVSRPRMWLCAGLQLGSWEARSSPYCRKFVASRHSHEEIGCT